MILHIPSDRSKMTVTFETTPAAPKITLSSLKTSTVSSPSPPPPPPETTVTAVVEPVAVKEDNSKQIIIIWQKTKISEKCKKALATIGTGVHIWDPKIDGSKLDAPTFAKATYNCLILWSGDSSNKTAAQEVHKWYTENRGYIKETGFTVFVVKRRLFSWAGLKSVYEEIATSLKKLPKYGDDLEKLLLNLEDEFPSSENSVAKAIVQKLIDFFTKNV